MINVMFCGNDKVLDGILSCGLSIFRRRQKQEDIHFYIITMDKTDINPSFKPFTDEQTAFVQEVFSKFGNNIVTKIDATDLYNKILSKNANEQAFCTPYTLLRLLSDLIPELPEKILYIDVDVMFDKDISLIYNIDVNDYDLAGAPDIGFKRLSRKYVNAGVLLLNVKRIKESKVFERSREIIIKKYLTYADQSAINRAHGKFLRISPRFNEMFLFHRKDTVIRHFCKKLRFAPYIRTVNIKQWDISKVHKILKYYDSDDILYEYLYYKYLFNEKINANDSNAKSFFNKKITLCGKY